MFESVFKYMRYEATMAYIHFLKMTLIVLSVYIVSIVFFGLTVNASNLDPSMVSYQARSEGVWNQVVSPNIRKDLHETKSEAQTRALLDLENFWVLNPQNYFVSLIQLQQNPVIHNALDVIDEKIQNFNFYDNMVVLRLAIYLYPITDLRVRRAIDILMIQSLIQSENFKSENFNEFKNKNKFLMTLIANSKTKIYMRLYKLLKEHSVKKVRLQALLEKNPMDNAIREEISKLDLDFNRNLYEATSYVYADISSKIIEKINYFVDILQNSKTLYLESDSFLESLFWQLKILFANEFKADYFELSLRVLKSLQLKNEISKLIKKEILHYWFKNSNQISQLFDRNIRLAESFTKLSAEIWWFSNIEQEEFYKEIISNLQSRQVQDLLIEKLVQDFYNFMKFDKKQNEFNWEKNEFKIASFLEIILTHEWSLKVYKDMKRIAPLLEAESQLDFHLLSRLHFKIQKYSENYEVEIKTNSNVTDDIYKRAFKVVSQDAPILVLKETPNTQELPRSVNIWSKVKSWLSKEVPIEKKTKTQTCRDLLKPKN